PAAGILNRSTLPCSPASNAGIWCTPRSGRDASNRGTFSHFAMRAACISAMTRNSTTSRRWRVFRACLETLAAALFSLGGVSAYAAEPAACQAVRLADVGWTDVTSTSAVLSQVLRELGYQPQTTLLSVPVTFAVMKGGNIDVFLGNWMPA